MGPHPYDLDGSYLFQNLVDKAMLDIDATRIGTGKVSHQFFIRGRGLKWVIRQDFKKLFGFRS
jgi:hypothetical protein